MKNGVKVTIHDLFQATLKIEKIKEHMDIG